MDGGVAAWQLHRVVCFFGTQCRPSSCSWQNAGRPQLQYLPLAAEAEDTQSDRYRGASGAVLGKDIAGLAPHHLGGNNG